MDIFLASNVSLFWEQGTAAKINIIRDMLCTLRDLQQVKELSIVFGKSLDMFFEYRGESMRINGLRFERNKFKLICNNVCYKVEEGDNDNYLETLYDVIHHSIIEVLAAKHIIDVQDKRYQIDLRYCAILVDDIILA